MGLLDRDWFREEIRRRRQATKASPYSRRTRLNYPRQRSAGRWGSRFKLFVMACLIIGPLWMWAYHENVPIAVTAWEAALAAYDNVVNTSTDLADDVLPAIPVEPPPTASVQAEPIATSSQKYAGGSPLNRGQIERWVIEFTNEERIGAGLQPLRHDAAISDIARSHSENMARLGLLSHDNRGQRSHRQGDDRWVQLPRL